MWSTTATFQAVSHLSKISTWVAAEKHNAPYPRVNPSFVKVNDKTAFDFSGVRTGDVWFPLEFRIGGILQENNSVFHLMICSFPPLWPKRVYPPLTLDEPKENITALLFRGHCFLTL